MGNQRKKQVEPEPLRVTVHCPKHRYESREAAEEARRIVNRVNQQRKRGRGRLNVYFCTTCDGWHVGHHRPWLTSDGRRKR